MPLTLAFYYPSAESETSALTGERFSALVEAVATTIYEYQHLVVATEEIKPMGNNLADKTINDEARSQCWRDSTFLALTSGTHTQVTWDPAASREALFFAGATHEVALSEKQPDTDPEFDSSIKRRFSEGVFWGKYLDIKNLAGYLRGRGVRDLKVQSDNPAQMNAVLSFCRAMSQKPFDLTTGTYPPHQIEYVPFFPEAVQPKAIQDDSVANRTKSATRN